ncbi:MAG TPA: sterol desaturase family protein [bacterium]|nr:sterol desaturase family protein [bacterium]
MPVYLQYYFWLIAVSLVCFLLERIRPWRREQRVLRRGLGQDLFWLVFNGHYLGLLLALVSGRLIRALNGTLHDLGWPVPESLALVGDQPFWVQLVVFFVLKDFVEWNIHVMLHRTPWLWEFHKLHHSIRELDWIGNFRFHWGEVVVYRTLSYLPLVILGVDGNVILVIAVVGTLMQDLNHSNLPIDWGPLRYVLNSARMHVWHHDVELHGRGGQNFGIVLSVWDWIFGTAYWPADREAPERLGFRDQETTYPTGLVARLLYPFVKPRPRRND